MKTTDKNAKWIRIALGLFLIVYALNKFFHFIPSGYGEMPEESENFIDSVAIYLPYLYFFEIIIGLLLLINKWPAFIYIVLFPLTIAFLIFTLNNQDFKEMLPALVVAVLNIILIFKEKVTYKPLFN